MARADRLEGPACVVEFPPRARREAERILDTFLRRRDRAAAWLGLPAVARARVYLVEDLAGMRRRAGAGAPEWAVAVTRRDDSVIFRLDRVNRAPLQSLDLVLKHEIVHLQLNQLASRSGGRALPRWFEEGLCVDHAGAAYLQPDTTLERVAAAGNLPRFAEADQLFSGNARSAAIGYQFGGRAVRDFLTRFGDESLRRLLRAFGAGRSFEEAFATGTGMELERWERQWRAEVTPYLPFWLFLAFENLNLTLLCIAAALVAGGYLRWRLRRRRALEQLGE